MLGRYGLAVEQELDLAEFICRNRIGCSCSVPKKTIKALEDKHYYVCVYCPECKKAKGHSNDPTLLTEQDKNESEKKEAAMCTTT